MKEVCAGYREREVLHRVCVCFEKGTVTSLIGPNGCGKSTLLKTMLGLLPLTEGTVLSEGDSLTALKRVEIARRMAFLAQGKNIPDMTVGQMVLHGRFPHISYPRNYTEKDREITRRVMRRMAVEEYADRPLAELSGGIRQNACIAMALAQETNYILLDEPTTYLDISHQLALMKILRELADGGKGIIAVMHDLPLAFTFSDRILVMRGGSILADAPPLEVCGSGVVKDVFGVGLQYDPEKHSFRYDY